MATPGSVLVAITALGVIYYLLRPNGQGTRHSLTARPGWAGLRGALP